MKNALEIEKLYVRRGSFWLKDVNLVIEEEKIHAVTGKSGSGKSTLIRAVGGAVRPEVGCIRYFAKEMYENEREIRKRMSVVYDSPNFNIELKPDGLVKELCKFEPWFDQPRYVQMMSEMELNRQIKVKLYSEGQQRKLMLILALCRKPELLVMDEATSGMDRASRATMWKLIVDYRQKNPLSVLFTTHHEEELYVADRIWQVEDGRIEPSVL